MKIPTNIIAGAAGALLLNVVHEWARKRSKHAPEVNKLGEEGVVKISKALGVKPPKGEARYASALAGDFIGNAFYYSAVGKGEPKHVWLRGVGLGLAAGVGALALPAKLGLNDRPVNRSIWTKTLTVLWYTLGGLAAAGASQLFQPEEGEHDKESTSKD